MRKSLQVAVVIALGVGIGSLVRDVARGGEEPAPPPLRAIPGVTVPDQFPRGCVDCHVDRPDIGMDVRISTLMGQWQVEVPPALLAKVRAFAPAGSVPKGVHPKLAGSVAEMQIPGGCLKCHTSTAKSAPPFGRLLHGLHFVGGERNHFLAMFQGECTHCHKLDAATGVWSIGSGMEKK